jgi:hypothetical protein
MKRSAAMSIQKKSLISTLKTAEKAQAASAPLTETGDTKGVKMAKAVKMAEATSLRLARKGMAIRAARLNRLKLAANHNQTLLS